MVAPMLDVLQSLEAPLRCLNGALFRLCATNFNLTLAAVEIMATAPDEIVVKADFIGSPNPRKP
jgi:hypothetical protein